MCNVVAPHHLTYGAVHIPDSQLIQEARERKKSETETRDILHYNASIISDVCDFTKKIKHIGSHTQRTLVP